MGNPLNEISEMIKNVKEAAPETTKELDKTASQPFKLIRALGLPLKKFIIYTEFEEKKYILKKEIEYKEKEIEMLSRLERLIERIPEEKRTIPELYVINAAMDSLHDSIDCDTLRQMYEELILKSLNIDTKNTVHPAYVSIINQLSPLDAKLIEEIKLLSQSSLIPLCDIVFGIGKPNFKPDNITQSITGKYWYSYYVSYKLLSHKRTI